MTDNTLFFDTDCISAFLWINDTSIITSLYKHRIAISKQVYNELSQGKGQASVLKERIDIMIKQGDALLIDMEVDSEEYSLYMELAINPPDGEPIIGKGEASCIAFAKEYNGILASNNFKDTLKYIKKYGLKYTTTADIMVEAYSKKLITKEDAENMWQSMLAKRRRLGDVTFKHYLSTHQ
ncbi:hypothetical protein [Eubacterium oxidoreducens]|uniref:Predicted nucleic acid-binding protein, contains PIN domain n=1 Tax=Eubacterium oxidoreducens TaxID=1732 RepID=A0A1G6C3G0_EUBOX|nr:hypothetical protein [Eubacterium oxidoreducens]SDB27409.1 Predicted nucleic acid-binding protein, contains PIN domain [Eubacterium oxidoreducens]